VSNALCREQLSVIIRSRQDDVVGVADSEPLPNQFVSPGPLFQPAAPRTGLPSGSRTRPRTGNVPDGTTEPGIGCTIVKSAVRRPVVTSGEVAPFGVAFVDVRCLPGESSRQRSRHRRQTNLLKITRLGSSLSN
jgi:hypothetical protein